MRGLSCSRLIISNAIDDNSINRVIIITTNAGEQKWGWLGREISDNHDTILNIINLPRDRGHIQQCGSGCIVKLNISNAGDVTGWDTFYRSDRHAQWPR